MVWNARFSRRSAIVGAALASAGALAGVNATQARAVSNVDIVVNGSRTAVVVKPSGTLSSDLTSALQDLREYVDKSTGVWLPFLTQEQLDASGTTYDGDARIYVGFVGVEGDSALPAVVAGLAADGFAIATYENTLAIVGPSDLGTRFGVSEFLESFVGVRWLMPTEIGEDVPAHSTLSITPMSSTQEPVFVSRNLTGIALGPEIWLKQKWVGRNRINPAIAFHHNLHDVFKPSIYADPSLSTFHEEYYPIQNGVRYLPPNDSVKTGWQPTFTEPSTVDRAVEYILEKFDGGAVSVSLGVNDSQGFSETDPDDPSGVNSQGHIGKSEVYFSWVNAVASEVAQTYPNRLIGCLAYNATADPPSFALEPNIVPYLTRDRYGWVDSGIEQAEKQRQTGWEAVADKIGWYDYMYGTPYVLPRVYPHLLGDAYDYGANHATIGNHAEVYPNWGEGPKPWVHLRRLWDPSLDVDDLLTEWYQRAVGTAAAPYLAQYYTLFENFWTQNVPNTSWFEARLSSNYFNFKDPDYVTALEPQTIDNAADLMDTVVALAPAGTPRKERALVLQKAFEYYEASAKSYPRAVTTPTTHAAALAIVDQLEPALLAYQDRTSLQADFVDDPLLYQHISAPTWLYWSGSQFWAIVDYLKTYEPSGGTVTTRLTNDAAAHPAPEIRDYASTVLSVAGGAASLAPNPSFETYSSQGEEYPLGWSLWVPYTGTVWRSTLQAHTGSASVKATALVRGGPHREITGIKPGLLALRTHVLAAGSPSSWHGTFQHVVHLRGSAGTNVATINSRPQPVSELAGGWKPVSDLFLIPDTVGGTTIDRVSLVLVLDGFENDPDFFLDTVEMHQAP